MERKKKSQHEFYHIVTINSSLIINVSVVSQVLEIWQ